MLIPKVLGFVMAEVRREPLMIALGALHAATRARPEVGPILG
jgi:hypothetical protein